MENAGPNLERPPVENKVQKVIEWMKLTNAPTARDVDPDGSLGIRDSFREVEGAYPDPVPSSVLDQAKVEVNGRYGWQPINISILKDQAIPVHRTNDSGQRHVVSVPMFKEQIVSAAQFLVKFGFEAPTPTATRGEGFVMVGAGEKKISAYPTKDPSIIVVFERSMTDGPVTNVELSVIPSQH